MRVRWKYIIFLFFIAGCKDNSDPPVDLNSPLYPEPLTVALKLDEGYTVNQITGDSIQSFLNKTGDIVQTGISIPLNGTINNDPRLLKPEAIKHITSSPKSIESNVHLLNGKPEIIEVDSTDFIAVPVQVNKSPGISEDIFLVKGESTAVREPIPVKALPMQFKDIAAASIQYLDIDQGLGYSYVNCILEDKQGYLWFGLDGNGLSKYDGVSFTNYTKKDGLTDNTVLSVLEDLKGNIWIGTAAGVTRYDGNTFTQFPVKEGLPQSRIITISEGKQGEILFKNENGGISKFDNNSFTEYSGIDGIPNNPVYGYTADHKGNLWISTRSGILWFNGKNLRRLKLPEGKETGISNVLIEDANHHIWIGTMLNGLYEYDGKKLTHYNSSNGLSDNMISALMADKKGNIWIGTRYDGVNKFDGKSFTHYSEKNGLSNNKINSIIEDSYGNIWIATAGGGVNKLNEAGFTQPLKAELFGNSRVRPIMKDKQGGLWLGTEEGNVYRYDRKGISKFSFGKSFSFYGLRSMLADPNGNLWFGKTDGGGLFKYDGKEFFQFNTAENQRSANILSILKDRSGNTWYSRFGAGINKLNTASQINYSKKNGLLSNNIFAIVEDSNGFIWMGTEGGGVIKFNGKSAFTFYTEREGLFCKSVTSIIEDKKGNLWFGTLGAGVCKFDGIAFTYFTEKEGMSNNNVWSLKEDSTGKIWVGTDKGLSVLIPSIKNINPLKTGYTILAFGLDDGLKATDFNLNSVCIDDDNRIWWGNGKSLETLDLNQQLKSKAVQSLNLNRIEINDRFYDFRNFADSSKTNISFSSVTPFNNYPKNLSLTYDQNHLSFFFSAIDWLAPHKIKYSYRLLGWADQWSKPNEETKAEFRNLPFGNYTFEVKAIGQSQVWTKPFSYKFIIQPAWWQTWWFKVAVMLTAALMLLFIARLIYRSRLRKQRNLLEKKLAVQFERQRISAEMHDDIGAGLSGIRLLTEMTKQKVKDQQAAAEVEKIYQSVGDISSKMKEVIWSLNTENDELSSLLSYIQQQARQWLEHYPCMLFISMPDVVPDMQVSGEARRNVFLIVKEAIHNIIKHSAANKVNINMSCANGTLTIEIIDDGKGMSDSANTGTGNGMRNMRLRMEKLNGELFIINQQGTTLIFKIPLQSRV